MTEHKFTDEEITRALKCCKDADCLNCPRWSEEWYSGQCADFLPSVLDLINRQKAEIERLTVELAGMRGAANSYKMHYETAKAEAVKEFAEGLKTYYRNLDKSAGALIEYTIDQKLKEYLESG